MGRSWSCFHGRVGGIVCENRLLTTIEVRTILSKVILSRPRDAHNIPCRMKSVLPTELETKRLKIAKSHNLRCFCLLALLFCGLFLMAMLVPRTCDHKPTRLGLLGSFLLIGSMEAYGIYKIVQHDNGMCRELGYMCPFCHKPLYEARALTWLNGLCPKCRKNVMT